MRPFLVEKREAVSTGMGFIHLSSATAASRTATKSQGFYPQGWRCLENTLQKQLSTVRKLRQSGRNTKSRQHKRATVLKRTSALLLWPAMPNLRRDLYFRRRYHLATRMQLFLRWESDQRFRTPASSRGKCSADGGGSHVEACRKERLRGGRRQRTQSFACRLEKEFVIVFRILP